MRTHKRRQPKALTEGVALSLAERSSGRNIMSAAAGCAGSRRDQLASPGTLLPPSCPQRSPGFCPHPPIGSGLAGGYKRERAE